MSYCRFHNTVIDLQECLDAINEENLNELSRTEKDALVELITISKCIAEKYEDQDEYDILEELNKNEDED